MASNGDFHYGWYIAGSTLTIDVYKRDLTESDVSVSVSDTDKQKLTITIAGEKHVLDLCGDVSEPRLTVKPTKIEISLRIASRVAFTHLLKSEAEAARKRDKAKKYQDMDAAGEEDAPNDLMAVIRNIYQNGSDDTKRAMLKSYQESHGTVLSTNWSEVSAGTVHPQLPGAE